MTERVVGWVVAAALTLAAAGACGPSADVVVSDARAGDTAADTTAPDDTAAPDDSRPPVSQPRVPTADTTEPGTDEDDVDLIVALWEGYDDAVQDSVDDKVAYIVEHAYPGLELTEDQCAEDPSAEGYVLVTEVELDASTIEPEPNWVIRIPDSPMEGLVPDGTIYVHDVSVSFDDGTSDMAPAHTTVLDGDAYFFFACAG